MRGTDQPLPYGGSLKSLRGSFRLASVNSKVTRWLPEICMLDWITRAPSGGKVITFWRVALSVSIICVTYETAVMRLRRQLCMTLPKKLPGKHHQLLSERDLHSEE